MTLNEKQFQARALANRKNQYGKRGGGARVRNTVIVKMSDITYEETTEMGMR